MLSDGWRISGDIEEVPEGVYCAQSHMIVEARSLSTMAMRSAGKRRRIPPLSR